MKTLFFISVILLITITLKGQIKNDTMQNNGTYKNEIGINIYKITLLGHGIDGGKADYNHDFANGITYKRMLRKMYLRGMFEYRYSTYKDEITGYNFETSKKVALFVGLEKRIFKKFIQPFFALDINFSYNQSDFPHELTTRYKIFETGLCPTIGIMLKPIKRLSITIETNAVLYMQLFYITRKNNPYQKKYTIFRESFESNSIYYPISVLSLSYFFN